MATTKTRVELVNEALSKLLVVGSGETPDDEDSATVDGKVDALLGQLSVDRIAYVPNDNEIPVALFDAIAALLANMCAPDFGGKYDAATKTYFEAQLRRTGSSIPTYEVLQVDYF